MHPRTVLTFILAAFILKVSTQAHQTRDFVTVTIAPLSSIPSKNLCHGLSGSKIKMTPGNIARCKAWIAWKEAELLDENAPKIPQS